MSAMWRFDNLENTHTLYREYCIKTFCTFLTEHATNVITFEKKKMSTLTKEELTSYQDAKVCHISGKRFLENFANDINYQKVRDHRHFTGALLPFSLCST